CKLVERCKPEEIRQPRAHSPPSPYNGQTTFGSGQWGLRLCHSRTRTPLEGCLCGELLQTRSCSRRIKCGAPCPGRRPCKRLGKTRLRPDQREAWRVQSSSR